MASKAEWVRLQTGKNVTDEAVELNPSFYNEKLPEFPTAKKLADGRCWKFRWFLDEN
jgi:hypothetical protein